MRNKFKFITFVFFLTSMLNAKASDLGSDVIPDNIYVHGFIGQGLVTTTGNVFYGGEENHISAEFTEIGFNASWRSSNKLRWTGQLLLRNAGNMDAGNHFNIDYLLADISLSSTATSGTGVRVGRFKNPLGFYNATRDVPMTKPSIFLPQSIYLDRVRNAQLSTDGVELYHNLFLDSGTLQIEIGTGTSKYFLDESVEYAFLAADRPGKIKPDGVHGIGRIYYEHDGGRVRLAVSAFAGDLKYDTMPSDFLRDGKINLGMYVSSAEYNLERWHFTAEYLMMDLDYEDFNPFLLDPNKSEGRGWYLQSVYDISEDWSLLIRYDEFHLDKADKKGNAYNQRTGLPGHLRYYEDWTIGLSWMIRPDLMLRAEYHNIEGTYLLSDVENPSQINRDKKWELMSLYLSWQF